MRIWPSAESASRFVEELKTTGAMRGREQEFLKKSGEVYTAELSAQVLTIQGEKVILTTLVDITARERAEEALRESESKFRIVADNTYDFEFWLDPDGRYIYASPSCERITGHKPEEFLADPELRFKIAHPEDRQLLMDHSRSAEREEPGALDHRIIHRDGSIRWIGHVCQPIFDSGGRFLGTRGSNRDITERKRAEDALRGSDSFNQSIIDSSRDCIKILDMDGRLTYMSPAGQRLLGIKDMTTYLNVPYEEFWRGSDRATVVDVIEKAKEGQSGSFRGFCPTADGVPKWWDVSISPVLGANGKPESLLAVSRDITDRRRDEARVARLARLYAVLSRVNETIVRTHDAERLYSEVCRIVSEEGGFPLTWVGLVDGKQVVPVACCGTACDYLKEVRVETEGELGNGPTGVSIREGRAVVNADFASSPATAPWRQAAQQHGFRASASFPLRQKGKVVGAFTLYSSQPGEFDDEQVQLFQSLSADVSYALDAIDQERLRAVAEAALREAKETLEVKVKERTADLTAEIDERKRAEERLTAASQYARSLIESSLDPLVTISAEGRITDVNEATIKATGATRVELVGTDFSEYFTEPEKARDGYRRVFAEGFVTDYPLTIRHRDGRLSDVLYNASVYKDRRGNIVGVFAAARDITDRKRAEQALQKAHDTLEAKVEERTAELKRSNEELEQFAYVASHDLQQPLRMVASYVALLAQRYKGQLDEKADKYIAYATNGAKHMQTLINDLLAFSRVGTRPITFGPVELERVVRQAKENLAAVISQSDAVVETGPLPVVSGDQTQLTQLFQNLLDNAIKFRGKEPPRMKITADYADCADSSGKKHDESDISSPSRSPSGAISATSAVHAGSSSGPESVESAKSADIRSAFRVISVADNGIGIATSHQERIFKLFQRLHTEEEYPGTGIGLAVCKKIVERHGGSIRVESEPGKGATFIFTLPGADAEPTSGRRP
jgi:PAS domain S-box-containing protein